MSIMKEVIRTYEKELRKILDKPEQTKVDMDAVVSITKILKNAETVCAMREGSSDEDYSGRIYRNGRYSGRGYYSGRMSEDGYSMNYSGHGADRMLDNLYSAMTEADSDEQKAAIKNLIDRYAR